MTTALKIDAGLIYNKPDAKIVRFWQQGQIMTSTVFMESTASL